MARKRAIRRSMGGFRSFRKRRSGRSNSGRGAVMGAVIGGGIYGAARKYLDQLIQPFTAKIPLGNYADNVALGIGNYLLYKNTSGVVKKAALAGLTIEAALAGGEMTAGMTANGGSSGALW